MNLKYQKQMHYLNEMHMSKRKTRVACSSQIKTIDFNTSVLATIIQIKKDSSLNEPLFLYFPFIVRNGCQGETETFSYTKIYEVKIVAHKE